MARWGKGRTSTVAVAALSLAGAAAFAQGAPPSLSPGQTLKGAISRETATASNGGGRFDCYALSGSAGVSVAIKVSSSAFAPRLSVGRGATCAAATYQFVQSGAADGKDVTITFKPAPGRYMVMVQAPDGAFGPYVLTHEARGAVQMADAGAAVTGPSRREIMDAQVGKRRAELAAEEARRQAEAERREVARLQAEAEAARRQAEAAAYEAEQEEDEPAAPVQNPLAAFNSAFNQAMQQNEADRRKQQQFLNGIAQQQREAQAARAEAERERAQLARQQAAERAEQARQMAAANAAQRQAAAQALAQRQQQQAAEQARRQEQQRLAALQQQRAQQATQQQQRTVSAVAPRPSSSGPGAANPAGRPSTLDDPMRCVTRPSVSPGSLCKGALNVSAANGCGQPVDIRLCLKKEGRWECGTGWGIAPQQSFSYPVCNATSESFMGARYSSGGGPMPSPR